jgi:hypothetical protein
VAQDEKFTLVIARHKTRRFAADANCETPEQKKYAEDLADYIKANGGVLLEYTHNPEIKMGHYAKGDHLNGAGKGIWTALMARDVKKLLQVPRPDRKKLIAMAKRPKVKPQPRPQPRPQPKPKRKVVAKPRPKMTPEQTREKKARGEFQMAKNYLLNNMRSKARKMFEEIAEKYPDLDIGKKAREKITSLD